MHLSLKNLFSKHVPFKQELLLRSALTEVFIYPKFLKIHCDHLNGINSVNDIELGIKYPTSFLYRAQTLVPQKKQTNFYFNGNMDIDGKRLNLLQAFNKRDDTIIIASNNGRIQRNKNRFNENYFLGLANSKFGLCPHQLNWPGDKSKLWTYRFIECCFTKTIPILFRKTPLGENFIKSFIYFWDDAVLGENFYIDDDRFKQITTHNLTLARDKFCLTLDEISLIHNSLNKRNSINSRSI